MSPEDMLATDYDGAHFCRRCGSLWPSEKHLTDCMWREQLHQFQRDGALVLSRAGEPLNLAIIKREILPPRRTSWWRRAARWLRRRLPGAVG